MVRSSEGVILGTVDLWIRLWLNSADGEGGLTASPLVVDQADAGSTPVLRPTFPRWSNWSDRALLMRRMQVRILPSEFRGEGRSFPALLLPR